VDAIFVGGLGTRAMGAAAVSFPISMIIIGLGLALGSGGASLVSRLLGEGNIEKANKTASTALYGSIILGIIVIVPSLILLEPLLIFFGSTETILPFAKSYGYVFISGSIFNVINIALNHLARAEGAAKISMKALIIGAVLNIVLDPIFIYTFHLGIKGAAIATVISQIVTTVLLLKFFRSGDNIIKISIKYFTVSRKLIFEIVKIGVPNFMSQLLSGVSMGLINSAAIPYGDPAVAAIGIVNRVIAIGSFVIIGFSKGFQPIAGFNYGRKQYNRLNDSIDISLRWTTYFGFILGILQIIFAKQIVSIFTNELIVINIGARYLRAYSIVFPLFGFYTIYMGLFIALGKAKEGLLLSLGRQGIFLVPAILILPSLMGLDGVIFSQPIADLMVVILTFILSIKLKNNLKEEENVTNIPRFS
jgi:putative MATE family efflux protein